MVDSKHPETLAVHAGYRNDPNTGSVAVPLYQTTSFQFNDTQHAENLFALKELGNIYTRIMNPTNDALEQRLSAIEGGAAALSLASGQSASSYTVMNLCRSGDNFVSSNNLYGGTWNLFANTLKDFGIEVRYADAADPERVFVRQQTTAHAATMPRHFRILNLTSFRSKRSQTLAENLVSR